MTACALVCRSREQRARRKEALVSWASWGLKSPLVSPVLAPALLGAALRPGGPVDTESSRMPPWAGIPLFTLM